MSTSVFYQRSQRDSKPPFRHGGFALGTPTRKRRRKARKSGGGLRQAQNAAKWTGNRPNTDEISQAKAFLRRLFRL